METVTVQIPNVLPSGSEILRKKSLENFRELGSVFFALDVEEQLVLLKLLRKQVLLTQARRLNQSVKKNDISMEEIVAEVFETRKARA